MAKLTQFKPDDRKLAELILLIAKRSEGDPAFGAVKLNKLLFNCDFASYLTYDKPITGQEYFALKQGPAPRRLVPVTKKMQTQGDLAFQVTDYYGHVQKRPIALRAPNLSVFTPQEVGLVDEIVHRWWKHNATEISDRSHLFIGWRIAKLEETIPYNTALIGVRKPTADEVKRGLALEERAGELLNHAS